MGGLASLIMSTANRGKYAEGQVKKWLGKINSSDFAYQKLPDTYAGFKSAALADFLLLHAGRVCLLEIKEVDHDFRLPKGNFSLDQIARQKLWALAGAKSKVLVYHSTTKRYRLVDISWFNPLPAGTGSWDLREFEQYSLDEAMRKLFV